MQVVPVDVTCLGCKTVGKSCSRCEQTGCIVAGRFVENEQLLCGAPCGTNCCCLRRGWREGRQHHGWQEDKHHGWQEGKHHGWQEDKHHGEQEDKHHGWQEDMRQTVGAVNSAWIGVYGGKGGTLRSPKYRKLSQRKDMIAKHQHTIHQGAY